MAMKLQRNTAILLGIALLLGVGVTLLETRRNPSSGDGDTVSLTPELPKGQKPVFAFEESAVQVLQVKRGGETLWFERDETGIWQMVQPTQAIAEEGAVAFLLSRVLTDAPLRQITIASDQQADFGFDQPTAEVELKLQDGATHRLILGAPDFSGNSFYALVDPETFPLPIGATEVPVYIISRDIANGVERPLAEWKAATDPPTGTASPPTVTPDAAPGLSQEPPAGAPQATPEPPEPDENPDSEAGPAVDSPPSAGE